MSYLHQIDPIAIPLPFWPHGIHWYGLMYAVGFALAWWLGVRRLRAGRLPVSEQAFADLFFYGMLGVVLGGRIGYVLFYAFDEFLREPLMLLRINEGGMSFHGGLLGVMAAVAYWSWRNRLHVFDTLDFVAPLVPPGLGLGRLGNFIGGELWGRHTDASWGVVFPDALPTDLARMQPEALQQLHQSGALERFARHPTQLYEALLEGLVMFVLLWWASSRPRPRYAISGLFALLYGLFRFAVEFVREPDSQLVEFARATGLHMGQWLSLPMILGGLYLVLTAPKRAERVRAVPADA